MTTKKRRRRTTRRHSTIKGGEEETKDNDKSRKSAMNKSTKRTRPKVAGGRLGIRPFTIQRILPKTWKVLPCWYGYQL